MVPAIVYLFTLLELTLHKDFFAKLVGSAITSDLRDYSTIPIKMGGCSIPDPRLQAADKYTTSQCDTAYLIQALMKK